MSCQWRGGGGGEEEEEARRRRRGGGGGGEEEEEARRRRRRRRRWDAAGKTRTPHIDVGENNNQNLRLLDTFALMILCDSLD